MELKRQVLIDWCLNAVQFELWGEHAIADNCLDQAVQIIDHSVYDPVLDDTLLHTIIMLTYLNWKNYYNE